MKTKKSSMIFIFCDYDELLSCNVHLLFLSLSCFKDFTVNIVNLETNRQFYLFVSWLDLSCVLHGPAVILRGMTSIKSNVHDILHVQHQFFKIVFKCFGIFKGKNTLFSRSAQKMVWLPKKWISLFRGGGVRTQSDKYHFFLNPSLIHFPVS